MRFLKPPKSRSKVKVYGLHGADGQVMYVGQTRCKLSVRLKWHMKHLNKRNTDVYRWMRWRIAAGEAIEIRMLEPHAVWDVSEVIWIERLKAKGIPLTNMTLGGKSPPTRKCV